MTSKLPQFVIDQIGNPSPPCPVCGECFKVRLYGWQNYTIGNGTAPSVIYRCGKCDFNFRRFEKPLSELVSHFKVAPYSTDEVEQGWLKRRKGFYNFLLGLLDAPAKGKRLLDVGCAFGHFMTCAADCGFVPFGSEVSEEMAELARKRTSFPVSARSLNQLDLPETSFDVLSFVDSYYYFENPFEVLQTCYDLLRPGGQLLVRVTNRNHTARIHHFVRRALFQGRVPELPFSATDDAICCHGRRSLRMLFEASGFAIERLSCIEHGKEIESFGVRTYYGVTTFLAKISREHICWTPGVICVARRPKVR